jgi:two-component system, OmpR family, copper resistance phosphate regulon response regulator CusR
MSILVVEDDPILADFVGRYLQREGFEVDTAADGVEGQRLAATRTYRLVILDLGLPRAVELGTLRNIRAAKPDHLILVLSASSTVEDRMQCLEAGADDFMTKPFSVAELSARIRALIRRAGGPAKVLLKVEDLELDRIKHTVRRGGCTIDLTRKEFVLLDFLMQRPLQPVSRSVIVEHAWKLSPDSMTNVVDVYINYLRKKIDSGFDRPLIHTIRGIGYRIGGG